MGRRMTWKNCSSRERVCTSLWLMIKLVSAVAVIGWYLALNRMDKAKQKATDAGEDVDMHDLDFIQTLISYIVSCGQTRVLI